ncbi:MAG TPA: hypothetical protein VHQ01_01070 [Pyrinomonadaceae bacterium]|nr:hypothetical protein [Pyrinomonadaceae bacterium]
MKIRYLPLAVFFASFMSLSIFGQGSVLVNDPVAESVKMDAAAPDGGKTGLPAAEEAVFNKSVLPKARAKLKSEGCEETIEVAGRVVGAFTRAGSKQTLIFYQFCQTGNGLGSVGVAVLENGKVVGNYVSAESGWSVDAKALPDLNQNGVDEIALYYSGGMHQGAGGTGVDIMEVSSRGLIGVGWFMAEEFTETSPVMGYKVTANPGAKPVFFREKYTQNSAGKWRKTGVAAPLRLKEVNSTFVTVN